MAKRKPLRGSAPDPRDYPTLVGYLAAVAASPKSVVFTDLSTASWNYGNHLANQPNLAQFDDLPE